MRTGQEVALRKRQQIAKASRLMFIWVAGASVIVGASAVLIVALTQKLAYNERVLAAKSETIDNLKHNNSIVDELKDNLRVLNTNQLLLALKTAADNEPVQVILDALPSTANSVALGSSLQSNSLLSQPNITIDSLKVTPVAGIEDTASTNSAGASAVKVDTSNGTTIDFEFSISTPSNNVNGLKDVVRRLELSIRTLNITNMHVEQQGDKFVLSASGQAFYQPAQKIEFHNKEIK